MTNQETETSPSPTSLNILTNIIASPREAFKMMQHDYPVLLPFLTLLFVSSFLYLVAMTHVDFEWFAQQAAEQFNTKSEKEQTMQAFEMMGPVGMGAVMTVSTMIGIGIMFCLQALYFVIVSGVTNDGFQFKQWFSFISWTAIPTLFTVIASYVLAITSSDGQFNPEVMSPFSINALFLGLENTHGWGKYFARMDLSLVWVLTLMTIGYSQWTKKGYVQSFLIVSIPSILIFGISALFV